MDPAVVGVIVGWALGFLSGQAVDYATRRRERTRLALAIGAEIKWLLQVVERRRYLDELRASLDRTEATGQGWLFTFAVTSNPFAVYERNLDKIGTLRSPLPQLVVAFYGHAHAFLADVAEAGRAMREGLDAPVSDVHRRLVEAHQLLVDAIVLGQRIVEEVGLGDDQ